MKTLELKVSNGKKGWGDPPWREVDTKNDKCRRDGGTMVVVTGKLLYAYCARCNRSYIGE
jgi:hypothetical protein